MITVCWGFFSAVLNACGCRHGKILGYFAKAMTTASTFTMTASERRSSLGLAFIFALRMLGLFLILPVFALHARQMPGGQDVALVGMVMGIYGLTQACLQIPLGWASDRLGRKPIITAGLLVFAMGSVVAALADTLWLTLIGRALQGTALIADQTRAEVRTKAMAMVGGSIALTFALSLILAPKLYAWIGMPGLFGLTAVLALGAIAVVWRVVPAESPADKQGLKPVAWSQVLLHPELLRLNLGIFTLHMVQMALFVAVPVALVQQLHLPLAQHGWVYLPVVLLSFVLMMPALLWAEKKHRLRLVFLASVVLLVFTQGLLGWTWMTFTEVAPDFGWHPGQVGLLLGLLLFFVGFNVLEASLPSLISRVAPPQAKGLAMGVYNTSQSLGLFCGGTLGGLLVRHWGYPSVFFCSALALLLWLGIAWPMRAPVRSTPPHPQTDPLSSAA